MRQEEYSRHAHLIHAIEYYREFETQHEWLQRLIDRKLVEATASFVVLSMEGVN